MYSFFSLHASTLLGFSSFELITIENSPDNWSKTMSDPLTSQCTDGVGADH